MSEIFVRSVVREYAESNRPNNMDLWPAIRDKVQSGFLEDKTASMSRHVVSESLQPPAITESVVGRTTAILGTRRLGMNMAMALVALLALATITITLITGDRFQAASPQSAEGGFLPVGKVRHMIYTGTYTETVDGRSQTTETHHEEFWLTEGKDHPLMRNIVTVPITAMTWLDDNAYYEYAPAKGNQVRKYPYDPKYLAAVVPDPEIISKTLEMQNARLVGDGTLDGRPVVVIMKSSSDAPSPPPPMKGASPYVATTVTYWIDRHTNQILQILGVNTTVGGPQDGLVRDKTVNKIALNELMDRSDLPADFFEFKLPPDATLVERGSPSTPTP